MRLLNLFDGIGGFGLAAKWMGWTNVASCEIDPYCRRVLDYWFDYKYIYMTTSRQLTLPLLGDTSTSLPVDSPASRSASPANSSGKRTTATCGRTCLEQFGRFGRVGSWRKTFAACLLNLTGWSSSRCALEWKLKATKYNRLYFLLQASALPTAETGSGLLPTATTQGLKVNEKGKTVFAPLSMLPTPRAMEIVEDPKKFVQRNVDRTENSMPNLSSMAKYGLLPTAKAQDCRAALTDRGKSNLGEMLQDANDCASTGSRLNPLFVGEMMGYPADWLVLPFLSGESSQSRCLATR